MSRFVKVAAVAEIAVGQGKMAQVEGREIALFNLNGTFYAIDNTCSHAGASLAEGTVEGTQVECPWHGARFDVTTGAKLSPPAATDVTAYRCRINQSDVEIELP